jgi:hypothetical protein
VHETGKTAEEKGRKDRSLQVGLDSRLYRLFRLFRLFRFPGFFLLHGDGAFGLLEERLHLLARGTLDEFNTRGNLLMTKDHEHISEKDYRV